MMKRDYRPYCFDSCNEPLKTRHQQLLDAIRNIEVPEVKANIDEKKLNDAVSKAIKENPMKVEVDIDDKVIVDAMKEDFCKVHSHITHAENDIIETLSCNCENHGCDCGGDDCECKPKVLTKTDLMEAVNAVNSHTDLAVERKAVIIAEKIDEVKAKVEETEEKVDDFKALYESFHN